MIKAIIIDDEPLARSIVKEYLQEHPDIELIDECSDGFEGIKSIQQNKPHLVFLDIQMPKINGFEMLELLDQPPSVIFTTAFDEFAIQAFENHAIDYLLKPFSKERFNKSIQKWKDVGSTSFHSEKEESFLTTALKSSGQNNRIVVKTGNKIKIIPVNDIEYIEASDDYVKIITLEGSFLKNKTMNFFETVLDNSQFVRTHRSYIINVQLLTRIDAYEKENHIALLRTGRQIPVSKTGYLKLKGVLGL